VEVRVPIEVLPREPQVTGEVPLTCRILIRGKLREI
jgi:hypothetical protein